MGILLTIIYISGLSWVLYRWSLPTKLGIRPNEILLVFLLKIAAGLFYGWLHRYHHVGDTWAFFNYGKKVANVIEKSPIDFLKLTLLPLPGSIPEKWTALSDSIHYWHELSGYTMVRISAWLHLFSFGHYEVHVVFWEFISLLGLVLLFAVFQHFTKIPQISQIKSYESKHIKPVQSLKTNINPIWWLLILIPGFLFWFSGVHKEGLSIFALGILLYGLTFWKESDKSKTPVFLLGILIGLFLLSLIRPYILALMFPGLLVFIINQMNNKKAINRKWWTFLTYGLSYLFAFLLARLGGFIAPQLDILGRMVKIRNYFIIYYNGNSDVALDPLEPTLLSFSSNFPYAIINVVFRPFIMDFHNLLSFLAFLETYSFLALWAYLIWRIRKNTSIPNQQLKYNQKQVFCFCFFFGLGYIIMVGLTVDNLGAIVRYRSIPFLFWTAGLLACISQSKTEEVGFN